MTKNVQMRTMEHVKEQIERIKAQVAEQKGNVKAYEDQQ